MDLSDPFNPLNPWSPFSPFHQDTRTEVPTRETHSIQMDSTVLIGTLVIAALILAGIALWPCIKHWRKPKKPPCQSCKQFISCVMAGVTKCPLLKREP